MPAASLSLPLMGRVAARRAAGWGELLERSLANENARRLRKRLTPQEVKLWVKLRSLKTMGLHIRRQAPVGRYIVDFVCFSRKIIIEADGGQHNLSQHAELDRIRDNFLRSQGYHIIRFWNSDIDANLDGVMDVILSKLAAPPPRPACAGRPSPRGGGIKLSACAATRRS